jgi:hypothetical protein
MAQSQPALTAPSSTGPITVAPPGLCTSLVAIEAK